MVIDDGHTRGLRPLYCDLSVLETLVFNLYTAADQGGTTSIALMASRPPY